MSVTTVIATYNGEKYIAEQITTIIGQLEPQDEVVIIDDCSSDNTVNVIKALQDSRIKLFLNDHNRGITFSFNRGISLASNDIIFMSDQDDIWLKGRVASMVGKLLERECCVVSSNTEFMDVSGKPIVFQIDGVRENRSNNNLGNIFDIFIGRTNYYGCAMAFKKVLVALILPIPSFVESHDLWIALAGNLIGSNVHLNQKTLRRRIHCSNASNVQRGMFFKIRARGIFVISIVVLLFRHWRLSGTSYCGKSLSV